VQTDVLLQTPSLLNALLNISMARNWFYPSIAVMHLHAHLTQALLPGSNVTYTQLPGIGESDIKDLPEVMDGLGDFARSLEDKGDARAQDVGKAVNRWGRLDVFDFSFKGKVQGFCVCRVLISFGNHRILVIGERIVTPSALVFLVVKLRLSPPTPHSNANGTSGEDGVIPESVNSQANAKKDDEFLNSPLDVEEMSPSNGSGWAHAPYWPGVCLCTDRAQHSLLTCALEQYRRPGWWIVLADAKTNRIVVPPIKVTDVPFTDPSRERNFRSYKLKFQAPPSVGLFTWRIHFVSDTFVGEDVVKDVSVSRCHPSAPRQSIECALL